MSTETLPTYDEVVRDIEQKLAGVTPKDLKYVHGVLENLPAGHKLVLSNQKDLVGNASLALNNLSPEQHTKMGNAMIDAAHTQFAADNIKLAAEQATQAVKNVEKDFSTLTQALSALDSKYPEATPKEGAFVPRLGKLQTAFRNTVQQSRNLAMKIAVYGERFDQVIAPLIQDKDLTLQMRKDKLNQYIKDADDHKIASANINNQYQTLKFNMDAFVGSFSSWATANDLKIDEDLEKLRNEVISLSNEIKDKKIAMYALGGVAAGALPVSGTIAAFCGPAAPAVLIVGALVAGITAITAVALAAVITSLERQLDAKNKDITDREAIKKGVDATRGELVVLGNKTLLDFKENVDRLASFWQAAENDCIQAKTWLEGGAKDVELPKYLAKSLDPAINIYKKMAVYLTEYARGVDAAALPN